ncbi:MAG: Smr/MutS family protein [Eubacteriales bacterium]
MNTVRDGNTLIVDIHGMRVEPAKFQLETIIQNCNVDINEIVVIHGYNNGQALKNIVRDELQAPRIKQKRASLNAGQTVIALRKKK